MSLEDWIVSSETPDAIAMLLCHHLPSSSVFIFICPDEQLFSRLELKARLFTQETADSQRVMQGVNT